MRVIHPMMHQQLPQASPIAPGYMYGTICRVNFWVKMTTALGVTQIVIGISCMVFYMIAFFMNLTMEHFVRYMAVGLVTGTVILSAGVLGIACCKKKTKCTISGFLILSALSAMFAMFPMVLGIVGATTSVLDEDSLMIPICQLVFSTVEIVVATWSIGVCCQAICCPNATFGQVSTRMPSGVGFTQFISSGDGQHVVLFTSSPTAPSTFMYNINSNQQPCLLQQGVPTIQVTTQPGIMCAVGQNGRSPPPNYYAPYDNTTPPNTQVTPSEPAVIISGTMETTPEETQENEKLLCHKEETKSLPVEAEQELPRGTTEPYEVEDEEAHLLC